MMRNATGKTTQESLQNCFFSRTIKQFHKVSGCLIFRLCHVYMFCKNMLHTHGVYIYIYIFEIYIYNYILYVYKRYKYIYIRIHILVKLFNLEMMTSPAQLIDICNITLQQFS